MYSYLFSRTIVEIVKHRSGGGEEKTERTAAHTRTRLKIAYPGFISSEQYMRPAPDGFERLAVFFVTMDEI